MSQHSIPSDDMGYIKVGKLVKMFVVCVRKRLEFTRGVYRVYHVRISHKIAVKFTSFF